MTSTQNPEFIPADDVYAALKAALDDLAGRGYFATHATALHDDPNNYECRCCTVVPEGQRDRYVVATGGAGTGSTPEWLMDGTCARISWAGDGTEITTAFVAHGIDAYWNGDPGQTIKVHLDAGQRRILADRYWDEIRSYAEQDDDYTDDDESESDLDDEDED